MQLNTTVLGPMSSRTTQLPTELSLDSPAPETSGLSFISAVTILLLTPNVNYRGVLSACFSFQNGRACGYQSEDTIPQVFALSEPLTGPFSSSPSTFGVLRYNFGSDAGDASASRGLGLRRRLKRIPVPISCRRFCGAFLRPSSVI